METAVEPITNRPLQGCRAWRELALHSRKISKQHLRKLFSADPQRGARMRAEAAGIYLDYSKNRIKGLQESIGLWRRQRFIQGVM